MNGGEQKEEGGRQRRGKRREEGRDREREEQKRKAGREGGEEEKRKMPFAVEMWGKGEWVPKRWAPGGPAHTGRGICGLLHGRTGTRGRSGPSPAAQ